MEKVILWIKLCAMTFGLIYFGIVLSVMIFIILGKIRKRFHKNHSNESEREDYTRDQ